MVLWVLGISLIILISICIYLIRIYLRSETEICRMIGVCETIRELEEISKVKPFQHFKAKLLGKDTFKLYPRYLVERYHKKYG